MVNEAKKVVEELTKAGFVAYFAGGCARDILLQQDPADIDIATNAKPEEIEKLFDNTVDVGKKFGVILVKSGKHYFETATFREEGPYQDKRRPDWIKFSSEEVDAKRRDFTINGIFLDPIKNKVIDYVNGQEDLKKGVIRFIGDPNERIKEDNLRLIRAIRFKITLNFQYAEETFETISKFSALTKNVSPERIRNEINKILISPRRHIGLTELVQSGITDFIIPEINTLKGVPQPIEYHHEGDVFTHTYLALKSMPSDAPLHLVWAVLLHDIGKPPTLIREGDKIIFHDHAKISADIAKKILTRLKFSRIEIRSICYLVENHMKIAQIGQMRPNKQLSFLLDPLFENLIELARADASGTYPVNLDFINKLEQSVELALKQKTKIGAKKDLLKIFTGDNLKELGYNPSREFKTILEDVHDKIISQEISSTEQAKKYVLENYKK